MKKDKNLDRIDPTDGLHLKDKRRANEKQDVFEKEDLQKLFCLSPEYGEDKHKHAHNFWIPILGLCAGARLDEICQLLCRFHSVLIPGDPSRPPPERLL
jgi:hypothetical protein